jgi:hypothetical protein
VVFDDSETDPATDRSRDQGPLEPPPDTTQIPPGIAPRIPPDGPVYSPDIPRIPLEISLDSPVYPPRYTWNASPDTSGIAPRSPRIFPGYARDSPQRTPLGKGYPPVYISALYCFIIYAGPMQRPDDQESTQKQPRIAASRPKIPPGAAGDPPGMGADL